jgi:hypothetical protein
MAIAIYTAACGGYDELKAHPEIPDVDFIAFSDVEIESEFWDVRVVDKTNNHPRDDAKKFKLFPYEYLENYEYTIWIDASHEIQTPDFHLQALASIGESGFALYEHPWRNCIYEEAEASIVLEKYQGLPIQDQVDSYRSEGHPEHWGLFACGTLARRNTKQVADVMDAWADEIDRWTYQDQLSLPVVCRRLNFRPEVFPIHQVFGNRWTTIIPHNRED